MPNYLVINGSSFPYQTSANKPYCIVNNSAYLPLTTNTRTDGCRLVDRNSVKYQIVETRTSTYDTTSATTSSSTYTNTIAANTTSYYMTTSSILTHDVRMDFGLTGVTLRSESTQYFNATSSMSYTLSMQHFPTPHGTADAIFGIIDNKSNLTFTNSTFSITYTNSTDAIKKLGLNDYIVIYQSSYGELMYETDMTITKTTNRYSVTYDEKRYDVYQRTYTSYSSGSNATYSNTTNSTVESQTTLTSTYDTQTQTTSSSTYTI